MADWLRNDLELEIRQDRIVLRDAQRNVVVDMAANPPFSSEPLLVADDAALVAVLRSAFREVLKGRLLIRYPAVSVSLIERSIYPVERSAIYRALWDLGVAKIVDQTTPKPTHVPRPK